MIYLDYNATTPIDKTVADVMIPFFHGDFGNPSSSHEYGRIAAQAVDTAREKVSRLLNSKPSEIIFTSGGSEANNTVLKGVAHTFKNKRNHIITSAIEHPSILNPCRFLEKNGYRISYIPVDRFCRVLPSDIERAITPETILVSVMHSNNETGTIQPIKEISSICKNKGILFHTDAAQSVGKITTDVNELGVDFLTIAGHKLYASKGIGALYIRDGITIEPLIHGANHENGRRAGTENVIFEAGLGQACMLAQNLLKDSSIRELTYRFYKSLQNMFGNKIRLNGHPVERLPNTLNISFLGFNENEFSSALKDIAVSSGSACHSGLNTMSPVLKSMGLTVEEAGKVIRFSLGKFTTEDEIDQVLDNLSALVQLVLNRKYLIMEEI